MGSRRSLLLRAFCGLSVVAGLLTAPGAAWAGSASPAAVGAGITGQVTESVARTQAAQSGSDVVVDSLTTPTEQTVAHPDGTLTRTVTAEPVRMQSGGGWQDISTDLVQATVNGLPVLKPKMTPVDVTLARGGSTQMSSVDDRAGHSIHQSWPFGNLPEPVVQGDTATYPSVLPGVDLIQVAHKTGVSQVLKIATADAAKDPRVVQMRILLDAQNATVQTDANGGLDATGKDTGNTALRTAAGQWWDSSQTGASASDPGGPGITRPFSLSLGTENGKQTQVFGMDKILNTPNLQYPLYVDPDWSVVRASYLYVDSAYPGTSYWNGQYTDSTVHVGYLPASWAPDGLQHTTRGFYQFATQPMVGKVILAARMNATETWASSCTATPVDAWVTGGVGPGTTWNAQPGLVGKVDSKTVAMGYSAGCPAGTVGFDLMALKSTLNQVGQWTVSLRAGNEGDPLGWKRFNNDASVIVTYDTPPTTPNIWTITNGRWTGTPFASTYVTRMNTPAYMVHASDPDGDAGGTIQVWMSVFHRVSGSLTLMFSTPTPVSTPGSGGYPSWQGGFLGDGDYQLQAQAVDQQGQSSGIMQFNFTVKTSQPAAPVITPPSSITTVPGTNTGNDNTPAPNQGTVGVSQYAFGIDEPGDYPVQGFVYAVTNTATPTQVPANVTCATRLQEFVVVCPGDGRHVTATVAPIDYSSLLSVWSFDYAGNVSSQVKSSPVSYQFKVPIPADGPTNVLTIAPQPGASWVPVAMQTNGTPYDTGSCQGDASSGYPTSTKINALQLNGPGQYGATSSPAVDTSQSFSVSGWFCPTTAAGGTTIQSLISQIADTTGAVGGALQLSPTGVPELDTWTTGNALEQVQGLSPQSNNKWFFLSAVYDKVNQQLRITVSTEGSTAKWITATSTQSHLASTTKPVRLGENFTGQILNPVMTKGVLTTDQFTSAQAKFTTTTQGVLY
ncbi:LamG-like jellyroll fold domain-containing protein [Arthrobacter sp. NPDC058127]|uniref:LamG-like jellyroll fold domain-containing protein n=1 Tax=Arthrobacter sp. NPDC058127 TaxID=3346351 RepID=UPI0036EC3770